MNGQMATGPQPGAFWVMLRDAVLRQILLLGEIDLLESLEINLF